MTLGFIIFYLSCLSDKICNFHGKVIKNIALTSYYDSSLYVSYHVHIFKLYQAFLICRNKHGATDKVHKYWLLEDQNTKKLYYTSTYDTLVPVPLALDKYQACKRFGKLLISKKFLVVKDLRTTSLLQTGPKTNNLKLDYLFRLMKTRFIFF